MKPGQGRAKSSLLASQMTSRAGAKSLPNNPLASRPRLLSVSPAGLIGRSIHWLGVLLALAFLVTAIGFAVDGWSTSDAVWLAVLAVVMAFAARGVRYLLARE